MSDLALRPASLRASIVSSLARAALPKSPFNVRAWAETDGPRWISGARAGRWDHATAPYLSEPMEACNGTYSAVAIVGPGQCGKTAIAENVLAASIDQDPSPLLWYLQTEDVLRSYVKDRINPLIETHESLRAKLGLRPVDDSIGYKRFAGMTAQFLVAARSNLTNKTGRRIIADEWDAWDPEFGDPQVQLDTRRQSYGRDSLLLAMSHCDRAGGLDDRQWLAGIMALYRQSTRCLWYWPCPDCGAYSSPNPAGARVMALHYPDDAPLDVIAAETRLACPCCGALIPDHARRDMNQLGKWVGSGEDIAEDGTVTGTRVRLDTAGYWIVGAMSPFLLAGIGGLAAALVKAQRQFTADGDEKSLREVTVKQIGVPYDRSRKVADINAQAIAERAEPNLQLGIVPTWVRILVAAADVQTNRFELMVRGYGEGARSAVLHVEKIRAEPATSAQDWDALLTRLTTLALPLEGNPARAMRIRIAGFDVQGAPGVTQQAYAAWRRARQARAIRFLGTTRGQDVYAIMPCAGRSGANTAALQVTYPDHRRRDREARASGAVPVLLHNTNLGKDDVAGQLAVTDNAPLSIRFPAALRSPAPPDLWFEQLAAERRLPNGKWERIGGANEALDLLVMTHAVASLHGILRLDWSSPPGWAAEWDLNPLVGAAETDRPAVEQAASSLQSSAPTNPQPFNAAARRAGADMLARMRALGSKMPS